MTTPTCGACGLPRPTMTERGRRILAQEQFQARVRAEIATLVAATDPYAPICDCPFSGVQLEDDPRELDVPTRGGRLFVKHLFYTTDTREDRPEFSHEQFWTRDELAECLFGSERRIG